VVNLETTIVHKKHERHEIKQTLVLVRWFILRGVSRAS